jgi:hypothetical protein
LKIMLINKIFLSFSETPPGPDLYFSASQMTDDDEDDPIIVHEDIPRRQPRYFEARIPGSGRGAGGQSTPPTARAQPMTTSGRQPVSASGRGSSTTGSARGQGQG